MHFYFNTIKVCSNISQNFFGGAGRCVGIDRESPDVQRPSRRSEQHGDPVDWALRSLISGSLASLVDAPWRGAAT